VKETRAQRRHEWVVTIRGLYWHEPQHVWVSEPQATLFTLREARSYLRDWAKYGAKVQKVRKR
jgi:hypothetical protein